MSEFAIVHRSALAPAPRVASHRIAIIALPEGHVVQVFERAPGADLLAVLADAAGTAPHAVRTAGPGQWFIVGDEPLPRDTFLDLANALGPHAATVDQSHGRVRIRVEGTMVERMLAKGTAIDLDIGAFPVGHSAATLLGHVSVHLTRLDATAFEIMVLRGFASSLWEGLERMSAEFG
ncbi:sarcosine oxidase subunit gamma family protein [Sinorhizobium fredii]|uniref:sarcosine oxidase subunit gamma family protein n=1 Tax=Rhizobium fredii TaxID=380 RepID=UPI0004B37415|nr:sarcosine oxidase subunit gamma family protein [Sinorhizobium fredii]AWM28041.1 Sarcosine oxidase gamma subunit [Sinorhizobium fredii CCBAU 25509]MCG5476408.1 sarcosine oxidase, subunit gamma [Sinorhizobium fredii]